MTIGWSTAVHVLQGSGFFLSFYLFGGVCSGGVPPSPIKSLNTSSSLDSSCSSFVCPSSRLLIIAEVTPHNFWEFQTELGRHVDRARGLCRGLLSKNRFPWFRLSRSRSVGFPVLCGSSDFWSPVQSVWRYLQLRRVSQTSGASYLASPRSLHI